MILFAQRRRLAFATIFAVLGIAIALSAFRSGSLVTILIAGWFTADAMALSIAYLVNWPGVFGKSGHGTLRVIPALLMAPMLLLIQLLWRVQNLILRSPQYHEISPDLFVGRICRYKSLPEGITLVLDLTAEFPTPRSIRKNVRFMCVPTLDGCCPNFEVFRECSESTDAERRRIYICCANGFGRSVTVMAAILGYRSVCRSAEEAITHIRASRREAAPNRDQMRSLTQVFQSMNPE